MVGPVLSLESVRPLLIFIARAGLGVALAFSFSMAAVGVAWGIYVFSGATSQTTLLALFTSAASIGAGIGSFPAWLKVNYNTRSSMIGNFSLAILAGLGGAWGGYWYSANQVVECCAKPDIAPFTLVALGATVTASGVGLVLGIARGTMTRKPATATRRF